MELETIGHLVQLRRSTLRESLNTLSDARGALCRAIRLLRAIQDTFPVNSECWNLYHQEAGTLGEIAHAIHVRYKQSSLREPTKGTNVYVPEGKIARIEDAPAEEGAVR